MVSSGEKCSSLGASLKPEAHEKARRAWRMPDALWQHRGPLLPPRPPFGARGPASMRAKRGRPCSSCAARAARGTRGTSQASLPGGLPSAASPRGQRQRLVCAFGARGRGAATALPGRAAHSPGGEKGGYASHGPRDNGPQAPRVPRRPGVPLSCVVDGAPCQDGQRVRETHEPLAVERPAPPPRHAPGAVPGQRLGR